MTTEMIAAMANRGSIATGDFNLNETLRYEVIPEYFGYLPEAVWRRRTSQLPIGYGNRGPHLLEDDFYSMISIHLPDANGVIHAGDKGLKFIGEDPLAIAQAESASNAQPVPHIGGYYIVARESDSEMKALMLSGMPDRSTAAIYTYLVFPYFGNGGEAVEMNRYMPEPLQHGLIHLLREKIYLDRFGEGDQRAAGARQQMEAILDKARFKYALARRNYAIYID